ncbi:MAG TPA: hypothetical protein VGD81_12700 [Opitutaceae bacterium]
MPSLYPRRPYASSRAGGRFFASSLSIAAALAVSGPLSGQTAPAAPADEADGKTITLPAFT